MTQTGIATVIALHCSGSSGAQWRPLGEALGWRCVLKAPDLIGAATAGPWSGDHPFSLDDEAASILDLVDAAPGPVHLVGHSYGGAVALHVAVRRTSRIASLVLYEPSAFHILRQTGPQGASALREIRAVAKAVERGLLTGAYREAVEGFVDYWNGTGAWARMKPHVQTELLGFLPKACLDFRALLGGHMAMEAWRRLNIPTLTICGEHAPRPTALISQLLHAGAMRGSRHVVRGAGHMGPITHPAQVAAVMADYILAAATPVPALWAA